MSRFGTGLGFNIQDIALISGIATEIFTANVANLNGTSQYFSFAGTQVAGALGDFNHRFVFELDDVVGTQTLNAGRFDGDNFISFDLVSDKLRIYNYYQAVLKVDYTFIYTFTASTLYDVSLSYLSNTLYLIVNGVIEDSVAVAGIHSPGNGPTVWEYGRYPNGTNYLGGNLFSVSFNNGYGWSESEASEVFNEGNILCSALWPVSAKTSLSSAHSLYNHAGYVGQELAGFGTQGIPLVNVGATPFTGTAQIECES